MNHRILAFLFCLPPLVYPAFTPSATKSLSASTPPFQAPARLPELAASDPYLVYYGGWQDQSLIDRVRAKFKLVVVAREITQDQVAKLKANDGKPRPYVFGYISIGEDGINAKQNGPPFKGNGGGPCYLENGQQVCDRKKQQKYASYYLDEYVQEQGKPLRPGHDDLPDRNSEDPTSGSLFVNTDDPVWRGQVLDEARRLVNTLKCDGIFLDTLDMGLRDVYKWTRPSMRSLIFELGQITPNVLVNRGLFFLDEGAYSPAEVQEYRNRIWGLMFENYYTEQAGGDGIVSPRLAENLKYIGRLKSIKVNGTKVKAVQVFVLDYIRCGQKDFNSLTKAQRAEVKKPGWRNYITWDLAETVRYDFKCKP